METIGRGGRRARHARGWLAALCVATAVLSACGGDERSMSGSGSSSAASGGTSTGGATTSTSSTGGASTGGASTGGAGGAGAGGTSAGGMGGTGGGAMSAHPTGNEIDTANGRLSGATYTLDFQLGRTFHQLPSTAVDVALECAAPIN